MQYIIEHTTIYTYSQPVSLCHNVAKLVLRDTPDQKVKSIEIAITPTPDMLQSYLDFFGNPTYYFAIQQPHSKLKVVAKSVIEKKQPLSKAELQEKCTILWQDVVQQLQQSSNPEPDIVQYMLQTPATAANDPIAAFARKIFTPEKSFFIAAYDLMSAIFSQFKFKPGFTTVATPVSEVMRNKKGVCQDFAHLAIACIRSLGLPARYMSGYIETIPPAGQPKLTGVDASHAWFSIYIPGFGWVDFDPTNNQLPGLQHITLGWGRDYFDIAPLKGVIQNSGPHQLAVSVDVQRSKESS